MAATHFKPAPSLTLYRGFPTPGAYVWSPFVTKLEACLRLGGVPYRVEAGSPMKAPRGKIPYVEVGSKTGEAAPPTVMGDSTLIRDKLVEEGWMEDLNARLGPVERAQDLAIRALLEEKLYFYQIYERWHENYYTQRSTVLASLPSLLQPIIGLLAYRKIAATLFGQGTMRYSPEEIASFRREVWESVEALLAAARRKQEEEEKRKGKGRGSGNGNGDDLFWVLGRGGPSEADAVVFGFIASGLVCKSAPASQNVLYSLPAVMDYAQRIHKQYFPDYALWEQD